METIALSSAVCRSRSCSARLSSVLSQSVSIAPTTRPSVERIGAAVNQHHLPFSPRCGKKPSASKAPSISAEGRQRLP